MLSLQQPKPHHGICKPNILPCRINHNGPVNASKRYWNPTSTTTTTSVFDDISTPPTKKTTAYFRGRRLEGRNVKVPVWYRGVVVGDTKKVLSRQEIGAGTDGLEEEGEEKEVREEVRILEEYAEFEEFVVWGHECEVEGAGDDYVRGVEEWIGFAETIHGVSMGGR